VLRNVPATAKATVQRVDDEHGNVLPKYRAMGSPLDPTPAQVKELNRETALPPRQELAWRDGSLTLQLEPDALALVTVKIK
jgi:xylan 1,4-beta-xylosidase